MFTDDSLDYSDVSRRLSEGSKGCLTIEQSKEVFDEIRLSPVSPVKGNYQKLDAGIHRQERLSAHTLLYNNFKLGSYHVND